MTRKDGGAGLRKGCTRWLLTFADPALEAEYAIELNAQSRRPTVATICISLAIIFGEFFASKGVARIRDEDAAARYTAYSRVFGFGAMLTYLLVAHRELVKFESLALSFAVLLTLLLFTCNAYRVTKAVGANYYPRDFVGCGADVCYDDTSLFLGLACIASSTQIFIAVRSVRSWIIPVVQAGVYAVVSLSGLGPLTDVATCVYVMEYSFLMAFIWSGCYWMEAQARLRWCENRRLRLEVEERTAELEEQQMRLREVAERFEAMNIGVYSKSKLSIASANTVRHMQNLAVPRPPEPCGSTKSSLCSGASDAESQDAFTEAPNALLAGAMRAQRVNSDLVRKMAERIREPSYGMRDFFHDALAAFPELNLFFVVQGSGRRASESFVTRGRAMSDNSGTSSGRSREQEYQRTFGALFAVYWLLRLDIDGKHGFCFGVDEDWQIRTEKMGSESDLSAVESLHPLAGECRRNFGRRGSTQGPAMDAGPPAWKKRRAFFEEVDWSNMQAVASLAVGDSVDRIQAMLCLTAFHDIMKVPELCPTVAPQHAPYHGYDEGDVINDHDIALAYVLEHYPDLLPSYGTLPRHLQEVVLFTQNTMQFNHGWFVQAEASPGAALSPLKRVLSGAKPGDLAFYFFHWLTDLSGAEGTPLGGAEKFVLKFPQQVLSAFLWSIPYLQLLEREAETVVVENYLKARWKATFPTAGLPAGRTAVAQLRLAVMAQSGAALALEAFRSSPREIRQVLEEEMARTGIDGQHYESSCVKGGPALLVYYGPALLQRCYTHEEMLRGIAALAAVYSAGRALWPTQDARQGETVTLEVGQMKAQDPQSVVCSLDGQDRCIWVLVQKNNKEAAVELVAAGKVNEFITAGAKFWGVDVTGVFDERAENWEEDSECKLMKCGIVAL